MRVAASILLALLTSRAFAQPPEMPPRDQKRAKVIAAASVGGMHLAYATWSYFAWYREHDFDEFHIEGGLQGFQARSYAGGADKFGHAWSNYSLTRATTAVLTAAGWKRLPSSLVAAGLTEVAFTLTEVQDGFVSGFSRQDMVANVGGAAFAVLLDNVPAIDRLLDFRLEYFPSADYRRTLRENGSVDVGQDYTGQTYLLALHLGALPGTDHEYMYWSRFLDLALGFEAHHYEPRPESSADIRRQTVFIGIAINMQGVLKELFPESRGRRIGHGVFEVYSIPYTTLRYAEFSRSPM